MKTPDQIIALFTQKTIWMKSPIGTVPVVNCWGYRDLAAIYHPDHSLWYIAVPEQGVALLSALVAFDDLLDCMDAILEVHSLCDDWASFDQFTPPKRREFIHIARRFNAKEAPETGPGVGAPIKHPLE